MIVFASWASPLRGFSGFRFEAAWSVMANSRQRTFVNKIANRREPGTSSRVPLELLNDPLNHSCDRYERAVYARAIFYWDCDVRCSIFIAWYGRRFTIACVADFMNTKLRCSEEAEIAHNEMIDRLTICERNVQRFCMLRILRMFHNKSASAHYWTTLNPSRPWMTNTTVT